MRIWNRLLCLLCVVGSLALCSCAPTVVQPLPDPIFRLNTTLAPTGCDPKQGKETCQWEIKGVLQDALVVDKSDNPFQDCSSCEFSQKLSIIDGKGGLHQLYYRLPTDEAIFVRVGSAIQLNFAAADRSGGGYGLSLRDAAGKLLAAFASGAGGDLLTGMLGEVEVIVDSEKEAGRETSDCGTKLFRYLVFRTGADSIELIPGKTGRIKDSEGQAFRVGHVNRFNWEGLRCPNLSATPFAFFIFRAPE